MLPPSAPLRAGSTGLGWGGAGCVFPHAAALQALLHSGICTRDTKSKSRAASAGNSSWCRWRWVLAWGPSSGKERLPQDDKAWLSPVPSLRGTRLPLFGLTPDLRPGLMNAVPIGTGVGWCGLLLFLMLRRRKLYCTAESIRATRSQNPARPVPETPLGAGGAGCWHGVLRRAKNARLRMTDLLEVAISFRLARRRTFAATLILRAL